MKEEALQPITVVSTKYDGETREVYAGRLLNVAGPLVRIQVAAETPIHRGPDRPGAVTEDAIELYFTDRWYNVLHFLAPGNDRYLWYSNIAMPATFDGTVLRWVDLDIDVCGRLDGSIQTLDCGEFQENRVKLGYPEHIVERALATHREVAQLGETGAFPFDRTEQLGHWVDLP